MTHLSRLALAIALGFAFSSTVGSAWAGTDKTPKSAPKSAPHAAPQMRQPMMRPQAQMPQQKMVKPTAAAVKPNAAKPGVKPGARPMAAAGKPMGPKAAAAGMRPEAHALHEDRAAGMRLGPHDPARRGDLHAERVRSLDREHEIVRLHEHDFHVRDVRHFDGREWAAWRHGYWHRDWYNGRWGWWYDVGGVYYPYDTPLFPYPVVVASLAVEGAALAVEQPPPPPVVVIQPLPALPQVAYYCDNPSGFYPTVSACQASWGTMASH